MSPNSSPPAPPSNCHWLRHSAAELTRAFEPAAKQDGTVWDRSQDLFGQLADGAANGAVTSPEQAPGVSGMTNVAATADSSAAWASHPAAVTITYTNDNLYRLTGATDRGLTTTYQYDPVGNRTKRTRVAVDTTYNYDRADHIQSTQVGASGRRCPGTSNSHHHCPTTRREPSKHCLRPRSQTIHFCDGARCPNRFSWRSDWKLLVAYASTDASVATPGR